MEDMIDHRSYAHQAVVKFKPEKNSGLLLHIFIYSFAFFTFYGYITNSQCEQLPDGFDSLVGRVLH